MNVADLLEFLACFGTVVGDASYNAFYDFDGNGNIGVSDLMQLLADFNPMGQGSKTVSSGGK